MIQHFLKLKQTRLFLPPSFSINNGKLEKYLKMYVPHPKAKAVLVG
jgi:hypothetical protein